MADKVVNMVSKLKSFIVPTKPVKSRTFKAVDLNDADGGRLISLEHAREVLNRKKEKK